MRMNDLQPHAAIWINLTNTMLRGKSQKPKNTHCVIPFVCNTKTGKNKSILSEIRTVVTLGKEYCDWRLF